ncbi:CLUMA_CG001784, isoform A [Clunio marinus]|uniref:CLUMA_CG001784, isoform A n=1 Tax=Clunio marinus TaxID=568069 RepID=A0A1J1HNF0_9DIPT|nr:CLUMA_CG001784, isoform A [Clunio marinus]
MGARKSERLVEKDENKKSGYFQSFLFLVISVLCAIIAWMVIRYDIKASYLFQTSHLQPKVPRLWRISINDWNPERNLGTLERIWNRFGYDYVNGTNGDDWDICWSHELPYGPGVMSKSPQYDAILKTPLKPHQRVNHFPGINHLTSKSFLASMNRDSKYILPGFYFPKDIESFKKYVKENPKTKFVEKKKSNRGIKLVNVKDVKFNDKDVYYQKFLEKPYLVEDRAMDFGIFVFIASIDPLRIYRFTGDIWLRFCRDPYYPFNASNVYSYAISDTRRLLYEMPELNSYHEKFGYSYHLTLMNYMEKRGVNITDMWRKLDDLLVESIMRSEAGMMRETYKLFNSSHHFFDLVRYDILINETMDPHIAEVNMSPSVSPFTPIMKKYLRTWEQLVFNTLKLLGAGSSFDLQSQYDPLAYEMVVAKKNIAVDPKTCADNNCDSNCNLKVCELCTPCLSQDNYDELRRAFIEHLRKGDYKRIFPSDVYYNDEYLNKMTPRNQLSMKWFHEKCKAYPEWC